MQAPTTREEGEQLFLDHLKTIEEILHFASSRAGFNPTEAEDFESYAKIRLIENDYAILRKYEQRASFTTYLGVVIHNFSHDYRNHLWGKWHASAEAKRLGEVAVALETILVRDGRTIQEAFPLCRKLDTTLTFEALQALAAKLPQRTRKARPVEIESVSDELRVTADSVYDDTVEEERATLSRNAASVVRAALDGFSEEDRLLLRLHYGAGMSVAQVARVLRKEQKPLYRRVERSLRELRRRLEASGITWAAVEEILAGRGSELDFGLDQDSRQARPSLTMDRVGETAEGRVDST